MILKSKYSHFLPVILMLLCLSDANPATALFKKKAVPEWVLNGVNDPAYFTGIGRAPIIKKQTSHIEKARADALNELAAAISVNLFSSNVLVTLVKNDKIKDEFNSLIRSGVSAQLEGYELVETYQDKQFYWVYYRLSKLQYQLQQEQKRNVATKNAISFFKAAEEALARGDHKNALMNYTRSVDAVRLYLNENIVAEVNGKEVNIVQQALQKSGAIIESLRIIPAAASIVAKAGEEISSAKLIFSLKDSAGLVVKGFPLTAHYTERSIPQSSLYTDNQGDVQFAIPRIRSRNSEEMITVVPDIGLLLQESSTDYTVRKAILDIPVRQLKVPVKILKPTIKLDILQMKGGQVYEDRSVQRSFSAQFSLAGYELVQDSADYTIFLETEVKSLRRSDGIYSVVLNGDIVLIDRSEAIRYTARFNPQNFVQLSLEKAESEAMTALNKSLINRYFNEMIEAIMK